MRVKKSLINISAGLTSQLVITLLSFFSRTIFIDKLGVEYLGINGLFTNVLGVLTLAEAGIGSSIIYALYKPVAENDHEKINLLMRLYRNAYWAIAVVVLLLGISLMPFLPYIIGETKIENITLIYFIFLISTVSSYLFSYKISLLNVNQKNYIVTGTYTVSQIVTTCIRIGILYFTNNYILYLLVEIVITITTSIILSLLVNKTYPYLKNKVAGKLDSETKANIVKNMKAVILHQIGSYAVFGTDNIIISSFVSVAAVGLYSNYYMLINICRTFINQIFDNMLHSIGNLVAQENKEKIYSVFKITMFFNFWIYSLFTIILYITLEPFIYLWLGKDFILGASVLIIVMINFYVTGMRRSINMVKQTSGLYHEDRFMPFVEAGINLVSSLILVQFWGIAGVFTGTLISALAVPFWIQPYIVFKKVFNQSLSKYFIAYLGYLSVGLVAFFLSYGISSLLPEATFTVFILKCIIASVVPNVIYFIVFRKTEEFKYLFNIVKNLAAKLQFMKRKKPGLSETT